MHEGQFILSFGSRIDGGLSQTWHRILSGLAKRHRVLHVLPHYYVGEKRPGLREFIRRSGLKVIEPNLWQYQPPWFIARNHRSVFADRFAESIGTALTRRVANRLGGREPVLYIWHPQFGHMVGRFGERLVCYHIYDDLFGYTKTSDDYTQQLRALDDKLLRNADCVFTSSRLLFQRKSEFRDDIRLVANGVDYETFASAGHEDCPEDILQLGRPIIGYTGNINVKVDVKLLGYLARKRPEWSIVLVGPMNLPPGAVECCRGLGNIHFLGQKPYPLIARYVSAMDVCIMPYVCAGWVVSGYPLKMHEYLAAGKPVVSVDLDSVREFDDVVAIAKSPDEWLADIESALVSDSEELIARRRCAALVNSWDRRVSDIERHIREGLVNQSAAVTRCHE